MKVLLSLCFRCLSWFFLGTLLFSCATFHAPRRYGPARDCGSFCREIRTCASKAHHPGLAEVLCRTARCETGNRCTGDIESPNRKYAGAFQFLSSTWKQYCEPLFPAIGLHHCQGPEAKYDVCCASACAAEMMSHRGTGDWPVCGRRKS